MPAVTERCAAAPPLLPLLPPNTRKDLSAAKRLSLVIVPLGAEATARRGGPLALALALCALAGGVGRAWIPPTGRVAIRPAAVAAAVAAAEPAAGETRDDPLRRLSGFTCSKPTGDADACGDGDAAAG